MEEIWKDIRGYEGWYMVSNLGRVKSLERTLSVTRYGNIHRSKFKERILKQYKNTGGYYIVELHKQDKGTQPKVHRLVAEAFIPNPYNLPCINHKDEVVTNNCVDNLEWCDYKYNNNYGTRPKRLSISNTNNPKLCKEIVCISNDGSETRMFSSIKEAASFLGSDTLKGAISSCCRGNREQVRGYKFQYQIK